MKKINQIAIIMLLAGFIASCSNRTQTQSEKPATLKEALAGNFYIGTALNEWQITGKDTAGVKVIKEQFNAIVAENCMKSEEIQPIEGEFDFSLADQFVDFGEQNDKFITGHCLIWHSQAPSWFFSDENGEDVSREVMVERMKNHIYTVVGRYKGRIKGWDVVNEAFLEDGSWRTSKFYQIVGEDFIKLAFQFANEADPDAELYYNDYNEWYPGRRDAVVQMVRDFKAEGIRIDGIGMQGHIGMDGPSIDEYEEAINAYAAEGMKVMITELDMSILPQPRHDVGADISTSFEYQQQLNPYTAGLPHNEMEVWDMRMLDFFRLFLKHSDVISRVTLWGVSDATSWKNGFPVPGRTDYPLLFDRNYQPKSIVPKIIGEAAKTEHID
ncbi:endo-1,4-beta-xylanase [Draconibacterium sp. IB214405]|uniref:endo-1,4-beta-xylanase n=1 Tax=Draconibacterium sp. IB214405 TaxID=3097352 RepID=UPI002A0DD89C|nr:endo-1,4-beta-xylanase [Draconibacterium sp. IB214405]MDX8339605.1 endo-1,4-beta-xylanase [Draconibacterium sp. IB214405]